MTDFDSKKFRFQSVNITDFETKKKILLKLLPDLVCVRCKSIPRPEGPFKERYSCTKETHTLCGSCKTLKCPCCGGKVTKFPHQIITTLLEDLPYACINYVEGCREILMLDKDLENHENECRYRKIDRPNIFICWMKGLKIK